jgi:BirA family biotin operon repressor/biotin-[acetyl-CoA-carboxylase] ligase
VRRITLPRVDANVAWFDDVDSTNAVAERILKRWEDGEDLAFQETVVIAATQRAGRGRDGRPWYSPPGGVYATWTKAVALEELPFVPLAAAVALAEAVESLVDGVQVALKWPNDVLINGKKLGGVLCQARTRGDKAWVAVGFGINVAPLRTGSHDLRARAVSLSEVGYAAGTEQALAGLLGVFLRRARALVRSPGKLLSAWSERSIHRCGEALRLRVRDTFVEGVFRGLSADGRLVLEIEGEERRYSGGEVVGPLDTTGR